MSGGSESSAMGGDVAVAAGAVTGGSSGGSLGLSAGPSADGIGGEAHLTGGSSDLGSAAIPKSPRGVAAKRAVRFS
jgi:hypothetical protein